MALLGLEGAVNLRDFGGYRTRFGRVRRHCLYRSGALSGLADEVAGSFAERLAVVCDLRREDERGAEPSPEPIAARPTRHIPMDPGSAIEMRERLLREELDTDQRIAYMRAINEELARDHIDDYRRLIAALVEVGDGGFLVHCSAGKDRTGWACALILTALGVPWPQVMADYLMTNAVLDFDNYLLPRLRAAYPQRHFDPDSVRAISGVRREYLEAARRAAVEVHGSDFEGYLREVLGIDDALREALRARLIDAD